MRNRFYSYTKEYMHIRDKLQDYSYHIMKLQHVIDDMIRDGWPTQ